MLSVTQRVKEVNQPKGGYLKPKDFTAEILTNDDIVITDGNIAAGLISTAVDYMTRFVFGTEKDQAFIVSLLGANKISEKRNAKKLLKEIKGLDDNSITCACKLTGYDVCYRAGIQYYKPVEEINPDDRTILHIRTMIERSISFFKQYGPVTLDGFTFEGGYSKIISSGDGDFLTEDTLWDFKVSKNKITTKQTLQLLVYYLMGCRSIHKEFKNIKKLGIFNPRLSTVYLLSIDSISQEIIDEVSTQVIGY